LQKNLRTFVDKDSTISSETKLTVLCVEDDAISRELVRKIISNKLPEWKIHTAENGKAGLDFFREYPADIVLTDINMPVMDGFSMASQIRMLKPDTYIIAVSAHIDIFVSEKTERIFDHRMRKPVKLQELIDAIDACIARNPKKVA
jgi:YesN/AraC family two-component response regulator